MAFKPVSTRYWASPFERSILKLDAIACNRRDGVSAVSHSTKNIRSLNMVWIVGR